MACSEDVTCLSENAWLLDSSGRLKPMDAGSQVHITAAQSRSYAAFNIELLMKVAETVDEHEAQFARMGLAASHSRSKIECRNWIQEDLLMRGSQRLASIWKHQC